MYVVQLCRGEVRSQGKYAAEVVYEGYGPSNHIVYFIYGHTFIYYGDCATVGT